MALSEGGFDSWDGIGIKGSVYVVRVWVNCSRLPDRNKCTKESQKQTLGGA